MLAQTNSHMSKFIKCFEDTLDQTAGNLESDNVCWVRYHFLVVEEAPGKKCEDFELDAQVNGNANISLTGLFGST
ncbi:hypothetical protein Tco_1297717 [Tanacetum coccineum]